jgi:hypothetical protein
MYTLSSALSRLLGHAPQMGNTYSSAKPALPTLNVSKVSGVVRTTQSKATGCPPPAGRNAWPTPPSQAGSQQAAPCRHVQSRLTQAHAACLLPPAAPWQAKHGSQDTPDDLYVGTGHPQRNVVPLSARHLPGSARKLPHTSTAQQQQQLVSPQVQESTAAGMDQPAPHRIVANNIVPALNMGAGSHHFAGSLSGSDQSLTARPAGHSSGPGSLPHVQQQQPRSTPQTSRPAYASPAAAPTAPPAADAVHTAPASVETGPITPAQALKRYGEYLTAFEQSEVLQYQQVS